MPPGEPLSDTHAIWQGIDREDDAWRAPRWWRRSDTSAIPVGARWRIRCDGLAVGQPAVRSVFACGCRLVTVAVTMQPDEADAATWHLTPEIVGAAMECAGTTNMRESVPFEVWQLLISIVLAKLRDADAGAPHQDETSEDVMAVANEFEGIHLPFHSTCSEHDSDPCTTAIDAYHQLLFHKIPPVLPE
jgi:hypothetical protein